jgi:hypothetical protein
MSGGRSRASADHRGNVAGVSESEGKLEVQIAVGDGGESETGPGGIVQVGHSVGEIDERHVEFATVAIRPYRRPFGEERKLGVIGCRLGVEKGRIILTKIG